MADLSEIREISLLGRTFRSQEIETYENIGSLLDNKSLAANRVGAIVTRTSASGGTVSVGSVADGYITGSDKIGIGWYDADGVFRFRMNVTVVVTTNTLLTISLGSGEDLPEVGTPVSVGKQFIETISSDLNPIMASVNVKEATVGIMLALAADIANLDYSNALFISPNNKERPNSTLIRPASQFEALNFKYYAADKAYIANLSSPVLACAVTIIPVTSTGFNTSPRGPAVVSGITWTDWWDFSLADPENDNQIQNLIAPSRPLLKSIVATGSGSNPTHDPPSGIKTFGNGNFYTAPNVPFDLQNFGVVAVVRWDLGNNDFIIASNGHWYLASQTPSGTHPAAIRQYNYNSAINFNASGTAAQWGVIVCRIGGPTGTSYTYCNQRGVGTTGVPVAGTNAAFAIHKSFAGNVAAVGIFSMTGAISAAQVAEISRPLYGRYLVSSKKKRLWIEGASNSTGLGITAYEETFPAVLKTLLGKTWGVTPVAVGSTVCSEAVTRAADAIDPWLDKTKDLEVLTLQIGSNDYVAGRTDTQLLADLQAYCEARKAVLPTLKIIIRTALLYTSVDISPEATPGNNTLLAAFNVATANPIAWLAGTGVTWADALVDDNRSGVSQAAPVLQADGVHLTTTPSTNIANAVYSLIQLWE